MPFVNFLRMGPEAKSLKVHLYGVAKIHAQKASMLFCDGHVENRRYETADIESLFQPVYE